MPVVARRFVQPFISPELLIVGSFFFAWGGLQISLWVNSKNEVDEILSTMRHDITSVETNLEESKAKLATDTDHVPWRVRHGGLKSSGFDYKGKRNGCAMLCAFFLEILGVKV